MTVKSAPTGVATINGRPLKWEDGRYVMPGDLIAGEKYEIDPPTGTIRRAKTDVNTL